MNNKPFIKLLKTRDNKYMYDVNKNTIIKISDEQYCVLDNSIKSNEFNEIDEKFSDLKQLGFLSANRVEEINHPANKLLKYYLENNLKMLILQVTQKCNFRCEYCTFSGEYVNRSHSQKDMSLSMAIKGIDFLINHSTNNERIHIAFYGGEPLIQFDLIKKCIEYSELKAEGKKISYNMTTNGSLLTGEMLEFFYKHKVLLTISLDGPKEIQNKHRKFAGSGKGSFDKVIKNIKEIQKKYPDYSDFLSFNSVIDTTNNFYSIDNFFTKNEVVKDIPLKASLISNINRKTKLDMDDEFYIDSEYELFKVLYYSMKKKDISNCSKIAKQRFQDILNFSTDLSIPQNSILKSTHPSGPCIPGCQRLFLSVDGDFFPCEKASESSKLMNIGHIDKGFDIERIKKILNIGKIDQENCKNCWAIRFCGLCACSIDDTGNEFSKELKKKYCIQARKVVEDKMKSYCFLKEYNFEFTSKKNINLFDDEFEIGRLK